MIYTGKISASESLFQESSASNAASVSVRNVQLSPYFFTDLYKTTLFITDKVSRQLVIPHSRFSLGQLFFSSLFFIAFIPLYLHLYHLLAYLVDTNPAKDYVDFELLWHESFLTLIQSFMPEKVLEVHVNTLSFSLYSLILFILIMVIGCIVQATLPKSWRNDEYVPVFNEPNVLRLPSLV